MIRPVDRLSKKSLVQTPLRLVSLVSVIVVKPKSHCLGVKSPQGSIERAGARCNRTTAADKYTNKRPGAHHLTHIIGNSILYLPYAKKSCQTPAALT